MRVTLFLLISLAVALCHGMEYDELDRLVREAVEARDIDAAHEAIRQYTDSFQQDHIGSHRDAWNDMSERRRALRDEFDDFDLPDIGGFYDESRNSHFGADDEVVTGDVASRIEEMKQRIEKRLNDAQARMNEAFAGMDGMQPGIGAWGASSGRGLGDLANLAAGADAASDEFERMMERFGMDDRPGDFDSVSDGIEEFMRRRMERFTGDGYPDDMNFYPHGAESEEA